MDNTSAPNQDAPTKITCIEYNGSTVSRRISICSIFNNDTSEGVSVTLEISVRGSIVVDSIVTNVIDQKTFVIKDKDTIKQLIESLENDKIPNTIISDKITCNGKEYYTELVVGSLYAVDSTRQYLDAVKIKLLTEREYMILVTDLLSWCKHIADRIGQSKTTEPENKAYTIASTTSALKCGGGRMWVEHIPNMDGSVFPINLMVHIHARYTDNSYNVAVSTSLKINSFTDLMLLYSTVDYANTQDYDVGSCMLYNLLFESRHGSGTAQYGSYMNNSLSLSPRDGGSIYIHVPAFTKAGTILPLLDVNDAKKLCLQICTFCKDVIGKIRHECMIESSEASVMTVTGDKAMLRAIMVTSKVENSPMVDLYIGLSTDKKPYNQLGVLYNFEGEETLIATLAEIATAGHIESDIPIDTFLKYTWCKTSIFCMGVLQDVNLSILTDGWGVTVVSPIKYTRSIPPAMGDTRIVLQNGLYKILRIILDNIATTLVKNNPEVVKELTAKIENKLISRVEDSTDQDHGDEEDIVGMPAYETFNGYAVNGGPKDETKQEDKSLHVETVTFVNTEELAIVFNYYRSCTTIDIIRSDDDGIDAVGNLAFLNNRHIIDLFKAALTASLNGVDMHLTVSDYISVNTGYVSFKNGDSIELTADVIEGILSGIKYLENHPIIEIA